MRTYLDNNATTPPDPRVIEAMNLALTKHFGNPASASHIYGWEAEACVKIAREEVADLIGAKPNEIYFTSGATESINLALRGMSLPKKTILTTAIEHKATLDSIELLKRDSIDCRTIPTDRYGLVDLETLKNELKRGADLVSIIGAHNEVGTIQDISRITNLCTEFNATSHFDLTQAVGKMPLSMSEMGIKVASFSAHKLYGPKGVGALFISTDIQSQMSPLLVGGGHERGLRSGTLNVPGIVGLGAACKILKEEQHSVIKHTSELANSLFNKLNSAIPGLILNGHPTKRIPGNLNITLPEVNSNALLSKLASSVAISSTSACTSGSAAGSFVLKALGISQEAAKSTVRIGVGRFNTQAEINFAAEKISDVYHKLRA